MTDYKLNDIVVMKKQHPCGENKWQITRVGADIKIKCLNCGRSIMLPRIEFNGPVLVIIIMILFIAVLSFILNLIGFGSSKTIISNGSLETTLVVVKNVISVEGIKYIMGSAVSNFRLFEPLVLFIISILGISICEKSGFLNALFSPLKRVKINIIVFCTILLGIVSTIIGDYSYVFLLPLVGSMYKFLGKNPILGIMTVFLGITLGYGTGVMFSYSDYALSLSTIDAAKADIDATFSFGLFSNIYIMIFSTILITFLLTIRTKRKKNKN